MNRLIDLTVQQSRCLEIVQSSGLLKDIDKGDVIYVKTIDRGIQLERLEDCWILSCNGLNGFVRAISLVIQHSNEVKGFLYEEQKTIDDLGTLIDCSRNAVPHVTALKKMFCHLAIMGYNAVQLYTEDTFEIDGYEYFGYLRGAYTNHELKELDTYASDLGIELVPCIQTLAHMKHALRWDSFREITDCDDILLVGEEKTYKLIEAMFEAMSSGLSSRRINIGMDEAHMLGLGKYLQNNGYQDRVKIMCKHLEKVMAIARKYGYKPMMWSDMFYRLLNGGDYYETGNKLDKEVLKLIPEDLELIYWDYYSTDVDHYNHMFSSHQHMKRPITFAGGAWKWIGFTPQNAESIKAGEAAYEACVSNNIQQVLVTAWGDNGSEASMFSILPVLNYWAEKSWTSKAQKEWFDQRFRLSCAMDYKDFMMIDLCNPDHLDSKSSLGHNPNKYLLYQDPLMSILDFDQRGQQFNNYYADAYERLSFVASTNDRWQVLFDTQAKLSHVLSIKADLGKKIRKAYTSGNIELLSLIANEDIHELLKRLDTFTVSYRRQWSNENKAFGGESFDIRIGGTKERLKATQGRLQDYIEGRIDCIEELEACLLPQKYEKVPDSHFSCVHWEDVTSIGNLSGV